MLPVSIGVANDNASNPFSAYRLRMFLSIPLRARSKKISVFENDPLLFIETIDIPLNLKSKEQIVYARTTEGYVYSLGRSHIRLSFCVFFSSFPVYLGISCCYLAFAPFLWRRTFGYAHVDQHQEPTQMPFLAFEWNTIGDHPIVDQFRCYYSTARCRVFFSYGCCGHFFRNICVYSIYFFWTKSIIIFHRYVLGYRHTTNIVQGLFVCSFRSG